MKRPGPFGSGSSRPRRNDSALVLARDLDRRHQEQEQQEDDDDDDDQSCSHGRILVSSRADDDLVF